jgi:hypothetical protein
MAHRSSKNAPLIVEVARGAVKVARKYQSMLSRWVARPSRKGSRVASATSSRAMRVRIVIFSCAARRDLWRESYGNESAAKLCECKGLRLTTLSNLNIRTLRNTAQLVLIKNEFQAITTRCM